MIPARHSRRLARLATVLVAVSGVCQAESGDAKPPAIISSGTVAASRIITPPPNYSFPNVEYVYSVQWGILHAGTSTVILQRSPAVGRVPESADSACVPANSCQLEELINDDE